VDVKLKNLVLTPSGVKVIDFFGFAPKGAKTVFMATTEGHTAPEIAGVMADTGAAPTQQEELLANVISDKADAWALMAAFFPFLGGTGLQEACGVPPQASGPGEHWASWSSGYHPDVAMALLPPSMRTVAEVVLAPHVMDRCTMAQMADLLRRLMTRLPALQSEDDAWALGMDAGSLGEVRALERQLLRKQGVLLSTLEQAKAGLNSTATRLEELEAQKAGLQEVFQLLLNTAQNAPMVVQRSAARDLVRVEVRLEQLEEERAVAKGAIDEASAELSRQSLALQQVQRQLVVLRKERDLLESLPTSASIRRVSLASGAAVSRPERACGPTSPGRLVAKPLTSPLLASRELSGDCTATVRRLGSGASSAEEAWVIGAGVCAAGSIANTCSCSTFGCGTTDTSSLVSSCRSIWRSGSSTSSSGPCQQQQQGLSRRQRKQLQQHHLQQRQQQQLQLQHQLQQQQQQQRQRQQLQQLQLQQLQRQQLQQGLSQRQQQQRWRLPKQH